MRDVRRIHFLGGFSMILMSSVSVSSSSTITVSLELPESSESEESDMESLIG